eukprot:3626728-Amphidinium_carterae.1
MDNLVPPPWVLESNSLVPGQQTEVITVTPVSQLAPNKATRQQQDALIKSAACHKFEQASCYLSSLENGTVISEESELGLKDLENL